MTFHFPNFTLVKGTVIKSTGSWYTVLAANGSVLDCRIKGKLRMEGIKATNPVAVGDVVEYEMEGENGVIREIMPRRNYIIRRATNLSKQSHIIAANIDRAWLIITLELPRTSHGFIDRFLATAEAYRIPVTLVFNKMDIYTGEGREEVERFMDIYRKIGYECRMVSALDKQDVMRLKDEMKGKINLVAGHSGVGKSTLINALDDSFALKVGELSEAHDKGTHTTTFAEMLRLDNGGFIIDTPGIKEFGMYDMQKNELSHFFPEIFEKGKECKYGTCLHTTEPGCAVRKAAEEGVIAPSRYDTYLSILGGEELVKEYE